MLGSGQPGCREVIFPAVTNSNLYTMEKGPTIKEIGEGLTTSQRKTIVIEVSHQGKISGNAVYRYLAGEGKPLYLYQKLIRDVINTTLGKEYTIEELWPDE